MPRLTPQPYHELIRVFKKAGFSIKRTRGSHIIMSKPGIARPIIIPKYDQVDVDIIKANLRTAKISREEYFALLRIS
jgi:predicted RNA binding protein YcfA (HicA-like mRNA interferase family)